MKNEEQDEFWMGRALELAARGKGRTSPNPAVGAVIVKKGKIIGEGWHKKAGTAHAEVAAIESCKGSTKGSTLYVTLEPCNHHGKTPPCVDAILKAGISTVVIGAKDPSPKPGVKGTARLKKAGVEVRVGALEEDCQRMIEDFAKHSTTGLPFVTLKSAITLDGKIATKSGDSKWISCEKSRKLAHRMRNERDAVLVGAYTVIADDPQLTVRYGTPRRNPLRVVVDGSLRISPESFVVATAKKTPTLVAATMKAPSERVEAFTSSGVDVLTATERGGHVDLRWLMEELGRRNVMSVLLEGGGRLAGAAMELGLVDRVIFFVAMKIAGGDNCVVAGQGVNKMADAWHLKDVVINIVGDDLMVDALVDK
ncbi:MAG: bifunctional diaminohydroxyphosphoribosylaminopyrimidine deaminase/5-amino-6-(5-phosphoribosylamino)uracil reductase RibD [Nitrospinae bacterium]|nr:bifunctional diaminohydroxyphosphoribosylaminopyrimidine deaminase/5-amino-6-(5-phosphoribosylamino)uracil reductase RibD [Nitrospinota bacterium]